MPAAKSTAAEKKKKRPLLEALGNVLTKGAFPVIGSYLGSAVGLPGAGNQIGKDLGKMVGGILGLPTESDVSESDVEKALADSSPDTLVKIRQIEADLLRSQMDHALGRDSNDVRRMEAVNETFRAEVANSLTNPLAGMWRPICGLCFALGWLLCMFGLVILSGLVAWREPSQLAAIVPTVMGGIIALAGSMAAILGVSAYKRGGEKKILAEGVSAALSRGLGTTDDFPGIYDQVTPIVPNPSHAN